jgi:hypothetical protein
MIYYRQIQFVGVNKNENGSVQVLEYSDNKIKELGVYDGEEVIQDIGQ